MRTRILDATASEAQSMNDYAEQVLEFTSRRTGLKHELDDEIVMSGLDSLQLIELATELEQSFNVRIDEELVEVTTFRDLAEVLATQVSKQTRRGQVAS